MADHVVIMNEGEIEAQVSVIVIYYLLIIPLVSKTSSISFRPYL